MEMELFSGCPSTLPTVKWKWLRVWQAHAYQTKPNQTKYSGGGAISRPRQFNHHQIRGGWAVRQTSIFTAKAEIGGTLLL